jgi:hypothetical protein
VRLCIATAVLGLAFAPISARADCNNAVNTYNSAISDISSTLRRYTSCVSNSNGHDDCSSEFRRLRSAQFDFESAVADYERECR